MRYGIISDIHSNYEALIVAIEELKKEKVDKIICCGDIVGYGPDPNECIKLVKEFKILTVKGNHDAAINEEINLEYFNRNAKEAIIITKQILEKENFSFLKSLDNFYIENNILFVHGSPRDFLCEYLTSISLLRTNIKYVKQQTTFCGHTHIPLIYYYDSVMSKDDIIVPSSKEIKLDREKKYIINVGSVGQPRDNDNRACVTIFDSDNFTIKFKRLEYNFVLTQEKMKKLNLPEFLISRLEFGR